VLMFGVEVLGRRLGRRCLVYIVPVLLSLELETVVILEDVRVGNRSRASTSNVDDIVLDLSYPVSSLSDE
jgi:hypothetical protein